MSFTLVSFNNVSVPPNSDGAVFTFDVPKSKVTMQWFTGDGLGGNFWIQLSLDGVNFVDVTNGSAPSGIVTSDGPIAVAARVRFAGGATSGPITAILAVEPTVTAVDISQS